MQIIDVLKWIRGHFQDECSLDVSMEVLLSRREDVAKVKAYTSMTGCKCEVSREEEGHYSVQVRGGSCRCG